MQPLPVKTKPDELTTSTPGGQSYVGYVTQAIVNNLGPLLFLVWHAWFGVSFTALGLIVAVNFGLQLLVDGVAPRWIDQVGYRASTAVAHVVAAVGLGADGRPKFFVLPDPYVGLLLATGSAPSKGRRGPRQPRGGGVSDAEQGLST